MLFQNCYYNNGLVIFVSYFFLSFCPHLCTEDWVHSPYSWMNKFIHSNSGDSSYVLYNHIPSREDGTTNREIIHRMYPACRTHVFICTKYLYDADRKIRMMRQNICLLHVPPYI